MFELAEISSGKVAELAGMSRVDFFAIFSRTFARLAGLRALGFAGLLIKGRVVWLVVPEKAHLRPKPERGNRKKSGGELIKEAEPKVPKEA